MNNTIFDSLYSLAHRSIFLDWVIVFCANNFGYIMIFLAVMFLILHTDGVFDYRAPFLQLKNKFKEVTFVFVTGMSAWIISTIIKSLIVTPRPFILFENVKPLFLHGGMESFPSGHAVFFSAFAMSLYFVHKRMGLMYFVVALIVSFARVAAGVHFPIDILAGSILGVTIAIIFNSIYKKYLSRT
ncbi:MAG: phosphatase PAP2 family protein [Candidatus Pacebacteria bacterium]|nr:phosphatase PAP2 family protein [Candidatus Paceibacterota bacterium]